MSIPEFSGAADLLDPPEATTLIERARRDPEVFIREFCWIIPQEGGLPVRFSLWDCQVEALEQIDDHDDTVVLKARQLGLSWLLLARGLWMVNCKPAHTFLILNRNLGAAVELLDRVRFMHNGHNMKALHQGLPEGLRTPKVQDTNDPKMPMMALANGSRVISLPSTEDTGSGLTAQMILADEVAKWPWPVETFTAIRAIVSGGGCKLAAVSTAKGTGNYFAGLWAGAQPGAELSNGYHPIFIPSSAHPGRDEEWLRNEERKYPDRRRFKQEHPEHPSEAFQLADDAVFEEFDRERHHRPWQRNPQWPMWRGADFGLQCSVAYWGEVQSGRILHICRELYCVERTTVEQAQMVIQQDAALGLQPGSVPCGVDPAGKARTSVTQRGMDGILRTDHAIFQLAGIADLRYVSSQQITPEQRTGLIKQLLRDQRLIVDCDQCPRLAEAFEQAQWKRRRDETGGGWIRDDTYAKDGRYEHPLDALGYLIANLWPPGGQLAIVAGGQGPGPGSFSAIAGQRQRYASSVFG